MGRMMQRLQSGERWLAAEIALRGFGLFMLALCALSTLCLYHAVHRPPVHHQPDAIEFALALGAATGWSIGWSFLVEGPGLFRLVDVPARHGRIVP